MKILFDGSVFEQELSGIAKSTLCLYEACHEIDNTFLAYGIVGEKLPDIKSKAITWVKISNEELNKIIEEEKIEYIHLPNNGIEKYNDYGLKKIITIHDVLPLQIPGYYGDLKNEMFLKYIYKKIRSIYKKHQYKKVIKNNINKANKIFTVSNFSRQSIIKYFSMKCSIIIIPNAATLTSGNIEYNKENYIIYFGGYHPRKGIDKLVSAFLMYRHNNDSDIKLLIVGKKNSLGKNCDDDIAYGVNKGYIEELGYISDERLKELIIKAKALFYLSAYEGFGLPIVEAMALGCPVVTTDKTSCGEISGNAAIFVDHENMNEIISAIQYFDTSEINRNIQIEKGIEHAKNYNWEDSARIFLSELKN